MSGKQYHVMCMVYTCTYLAELKAPHPNFVRTAPVALSSSILDTQKHPLAQRTPQSYLRERALPATSGDLSIEVSHAPPRDSMD